MTSRIPIPLVRQELKVWVTKMPVGRGVIDTPLGRMVVTASEDGIRRLEWSDEPGNDSQIGRKHVEATREWVRAFFQRREAPPTPALDRSSLSAFQKKVLAALPEVARFGEVVSYGELAIAAGCENSSRAVGSAMARNPWALLIPCHRVIRQDGEIGNYSGCNGPETKAWLLEHESGVLGAGVRSK